MAVIPPDAGLRLRLQTDPSPLQALGPARAIPGDLPDFQPGQTFTARILEALPDATYRALIAGKQVTLQLPEGASPGDSLELSVVDRTGQLLIAKRTDGQSATPAEARPYPYTRISDAGRMIGNLLPAEGETPPAATLNRGQPLVNTPPASAADLLPVLQKAVSQSGLFYESHQAQWVMGERPLAALRQEPQGQLPATPSTPEHARTAASAESTQAASAARTDTSQSSVTANTRGETSNAAQGLAGQSASTNATVPDAIRNIVQQQLDAVATQRLAWHGEVWPGQNADWTIQRDEVADRDRSNDADTADAARWSTTLRLSMPQLGTVDAVLQLTGGRLSVRLAADPASAGDLRGAAPALASALSAAGIAVQDIEIRNEE